MHIFTGRVQSTLSDQGVALQDRSRLTELLAAEAVAGHLTIPSSPVDNPAGHYMHQHKVVALGKLSKINEYQTIDIDQTEQLILQLWLTRYRLVHMPTDHRVNHLTRIAIREGNHGIPKQYTDVIARYPETGLRSYHVADEEDLK